MLDALPFIWVQLLVTIIALVAALGAWWLLFKRGWFFAFMKGVTGLFMLTTMVVCLFFILEIQSFKQMNAEKQLATIKMVQKGAQQFEVEFNRNSGQSETFNIQGDMWQLDAKVITWEGWLTLFGLKPGYRMERISGRYRSIEDERNKPRTVFEFKNSLSPGAVNVGEFIPGINYRFGNAVYMPMIDGALFEVLITSKGISAKPVNDVAQNSLLGWY